MLSLLTQLRRCGLLTVRGTWRLLESIIVTGITPMTLLRLRASLHPDRIALTDHRESLSYRELWEQSETLARGLQSHCGIQPGWKVAVACRDHASLVKSLFAVSRLGAHVFLVNPRLSPMQLESLADQIRLDFLIHDDCGNELANDSPLRKRCIPSYHPTEPAIDGLSRDEQAVERLRRVKAGNIVVMTGGTTGRPKAAGRKPSILMFLPPFCALVSEVRLGEHQSVYVATPVYHGFGLAALFMGIALGVTVYVRERFEAEPACALIARHQIEAITVVPVMLQRMLAHAPDQMKPLKCVISGGALLNPQLARETLQSLGPVLFNMYGTSEAGVCIMADSDLLSRRPESIGRPLPGVRVRILDSHGQSVPDGEAGRLAIRSTWTVNRSNWTETGDIAIRDADGNLFLRGRSDDMIVSGGENVYPIELENVLVTHPDIESVAVVGIPDSEFGQRLLAVIKLRSETAVDEESLRDWLRSRVARHQMPARIEFRAELPYTAVGKIDKKALRQS